MAKKPPPLPPVPNSEPEWLFPYPFMNVGDSFFIPTMRPSHLIYVIDVTSKKAGVLMKAYPRHEKGILGVRAWRVG
jgi:hypothetical protein